MRTLEDLSPEPLWIRRTSCLRRPASANKAESIPKLCDFEDSIPQQPTKKSQDSIGAHAPETTIAGNGRPIPVQMVFPASCHRNTPSRHLCAIRRDRPNSCRGGELPKTPSYRGEDSLPIRVSDPMSHPVRNRKMVDRKMECRHFPFSCSSPPQLVQTQSSVFGAALSTVVFRLPWMALILACTVLTEPSPRCSPKSTAIA